MGEGESKTVRLVACICEDCAAKRGGVWDSFPNGGRIASGKVAPFRLALCSLCAEYRPVYSPLIWNLDHLGQKIP